MGTATKTATRKATRPAPKVSVSPERRQMRQRKQEISDEYGDGKYLLVTNRHAEHITFADKQEKGDLQVAPFATEIMEEFWLDDPSLLRAHADGRIDITRSNAIPPKIDLNVPQELDLHSVPLLNATAISIVLSETFGDREKSVILTPANRSGGSNSAKRPDKNWLKTAGVKMLRNIIYREERVRNRADVIGLCRMRIDAILAME